MSLENTLYIMYCRIYREVIQYYFIRTSDLPQIIMVQCDCERVVFTECNKNKWQRDILGVS